MAGLAQVFYVLAARHGFAHVPGPQAATMTMAGAATLYLIIGVWRSARSGRWPARCRAARRWCRSCSRASSARACRPLAFITGIRRLGPSQAAIIATLEPVVGVGLAAWLLGERPAPIQLVGGALILGAAVLLQLRPGVPAEHEAIATDEREDSDRVQHR